MTDETSDDGFAVGYKKPPQHSRFQPGRSGNPRGKQKGVRNLGSDVKRTLEVPVRLNEQGRARRVSPWSRRRRLAGSEADIARYGRRMAAIWPIRLREVSYSLKKPAKAKAAS